MGPGAATPIAVIGSPSATCSMRWVISTIPWASVSGVSTLAWRISLPSPSPAATKIFDPPISTPIYIWLLYRLRCNPYYPYRLWLLTLPVPYVMMLYRLVGRFGRGPSRRDYECSPPCIFFCDGVPSKSVSPGCPCFKTERSSILSSNEGAVKHKGGDMNRDVLTTVGGLILVGVVVVATFLYGNQQRQAQLRQQQTTQKQQQQKAATPAKPKAVSGSAKSQPAAPTTTSATPTQQPAAGQAS